MTFIGIVLLLLFAATFFIPLPSDSSAEAGRGYRREYPRVFEVLRKRGIRIALLIAGVVLTVMTGLFFYANPGTAYAVQYLWGGDEAVTSQGFKPKLFGRVLPFSFEIAFQDTIGETANTNGEIYYRKAKRYEFADAIKADVATSLVIGVNYHDRETFLDMADRNRSEQKLVWARIIPDYDQAIKNTCKLMDAQDYISGGAAQFDFYLLDQLINGTYVTEEVYRDDEVVVIADTATTRSVVTDRPLKQRGTERSKRYTIKRNSAGEPMRNSSSNSIRNYNLTVLQAAVTQIDWEDSFDDRLDLQKDQVAKTQLEKQTAEKEYYATLAAIQKGERVKTERQKELEKDQIEKTIAAETAAKVAYFSVQEEKNKLEAARLEAQRIEVTSNAEADRNRRLVNAGLSPQERAKIDMDTQIGVAKAFAGMTPPTTVIVGGGSGGGNVTEALIQATMAKQLLSDKKKD